jgi:hypothetical protein
MRHARSLAFALVAAVLAVGAVLACSSVQNTRIGIDAPPYSDQSFSVVGDYLGQRCGTLDCHGQSGRNLRVWSCTGMRLDSESNPQSCIEPTTEAEYEATYRSLVALEPQVMTTVYTGCAVTDGAAATYPPGPSCHPELLTFIAKARGTESHKGGQLICVEPPCPDGIPPQVPLDGDAGPLVDLQDVCLVSWLQGQTDVDACVTAATYPIFPIVDAGVSE